MQSTSVRIVIIKICKVSRDRMLRSIVDRPSLDFKGIDKMSQTRQSAFNVFRLSVFSLCALIVIVKKKESHCEEKRKPL